MSILEVVKDMVEQMTDTDLQRAMVYFERMYTPGGLKKHPSYAALMREAANRGLRVESLTEQEILTRMEVEGPGMNRPG